MRERLILCLPILLYAAWTDARENRISRGSVLAWLILSGGKRLLTGSPGELAEASCAAGLIWLGLYPLARRDWLGGADGKLLALLVFTSGGPGTMRFWKWMGVTVTIVFAICLIGRIRGEDPGRKIPLAPWVLTAALASLIPDGSRSLAIP